MAYNNQRGGGQQQQSYPNSGALFPQQKKQQNSPDMTGNVVISEDVLEYILSRAADHGEIKLDLAGWRRQAQSGVNFVSLKINIPYSERQQQDGPAPQYRPQQNYQQRRPVDRGERDQYGGYQRGPQQNQNRPQQGYAGNAGQQGGRFSTSPRREPEPQMPDFMQDDLNDEIPFGD